MGDGNTKKKINNRPQMSKRNETVSALVEYNELYGFLMCMLFISTSNTTTTTKCNGTRTFSFSANASNMNECESMSELFAQCDREKKIPSLKIIYRMSTSIVTSILL